MKNYLENIEFALQWLNKNNAPPEIKKSIVKILEMNIQYMGSETRTLHLLERIERDLPSDQFLEIKKEICNRVREINDAIKKMTGTVDTDIKQILSRIEDRLKDE